MEKSALIKIDSSFENAVWKKSAILTRAELVE